MPDLSSVYVPPFPDLSVDAPGDLAGDPGAGASGATSSSGGGGGGGLVLAVECRWSGRVRTFAIAGAACSTARRGGGKKSAAAALPSSSSSAAAAAPARSLEEHVREWAARKVAAGVPAPHCVLPFLTGAPKAIECRLCSKIIYPGEEIKCTVSRCEEIFHQSCAERDSGNFGAESFKCPQHGCIVCKQKTFFWRCGRCTVAAHTKCAPWPIIHLKDDQGSAICWRHPSNWLLGNEDCFI